MSGSAATSSTRKPGATENVLSASWGKSGGAGGATTPSADCSVGPVAGRVEAVVVGRDDGLDAGRVDGAVAGSAAGTVAAGTAACGFARPRAPEAHAPVKNAPAHPAITT